MTNRQNPNRIRQTVNAAADLRNGVQKKTISNQIGKIKHVKVLEIKMEDPAEMMTGADLINSKSAAIVIREDSVRMMTEEDSAEMMTEAVLINSKSAAIVIREDSAEMMTGEDSVRMMTEEDSAEMMTGEDSVRMMTEEDSAEMMIGADLINSKSAAIVIREDSAEMMTREDSVRMMTEEDSAEMMTEEDSAEMMIGADLINSKSATIVIREDSAEMMTEEDSAEMMIGADLINSKSATIVIREDSAEMMIGADLINSKSVAIVILADTAGMMTGAVLEADAIQMRLMMAIVAVDTKERKMMVILIQAGAKDVVANAAVQDTGIGADLAVVPEVRVVEVADLVGMTKNVEQNRGSALVEGRHKGTYLVRSDGRMNLATENLVPGNTVYKERLVEKKGVEYRTWDPFRSKLAASIKNGLETFPFTNGSSVLYLGVSSGTTASHISDIVGPQGMMFCVEHASRVARDFLDRVASYRKNIVPVLQDARRPREYSAVYGKVDVVYADIAQPDQTQIVLENCQIYLKEGGVLFLVIKTRSIDVVKTPSQVVKEEKEKIARKMDVLEVIDLLPYDKDHAMIVAH